MVSHCYKINYRSPCTKSRRIFDCRRNMCSNISDVRALVSVTQSAATDDVTVSSSSLQQLMTSSVVVVAAAPGALWVWVVMTAVAWWVGDGSTHALSTPSPHLRSPRGGATVWWNWLVDVVDVVAVVVVVAGLDSGWDRRVMTSQARRTQLKADITQRPHTPVCMQTRQNGRNGTALYWKPVSELQSVTCHMESHSVACHLTDLLTPKFLLFVHYP